MGRFKRGIILSYRPTEHWRSSDFLPPHPRERRSALTRSPAAVLSLTRVVSQFPFSAADFASNRSGKSFVFWQCELGGAGSRRLVAELQLPGGDWPRCSNGGPWAADVGAPPHTPTSPTSFPSTSTPPQPLHSALPFALIVTHCLLRLEMWLTTRAICWSTTEGFSPGVFFWRAPCVLVILGNGCGDDPGSCHDSGFVCAPVRAARLILSNGR